MSAEFDLAEVERGLAGTRFAGHLHHFASVGSTNALALEAAAGGERMGAWVADEQTAGRGRGGHHWHSAVGDGLYVTALVAPQIALADAAKIPLATGLAAQAAILETTGLLVDIRWPNDLMFGDRKCGGILVESVSDGDRLRYAAVGIGINLNHGAFPPDLASVASSLYLESERRYPREPLLVALLQHLDGELQALEGGGRELLGRFSDMSGWVRGKRVTVGEDGGYTGWTHGLDTQGFLLVKDDQGVSRTLLSGGVRSA